MAAPSRTKNSPSFCDALTLADVKCGQTSAEIFDHCFSGCAFCGAPGRPQPAGVNFGDGRMKLAFTGSGDIKRFVREHLQARKDLRGSTVVDVPAGRGVMSRVLKECGADVKAYDLFPHVFEVEGLECTEADLMAGLPISSGGAELVLFQEGIEHLPNQLVALQELNRVLRPGGRLLVTTPNISQLRAKFSNLLTESDLYKRMPPNELDALWFADSGKMYFGHIFLVGVQRLRVLARAAGFRLRAVHRVRASPGALLLGFLYPLIALVNGYVYIRHVMRNDGIPRDAKRRIYREIAWLNLHPAVLFGRHLFLEFEKEFAAEDAPSKVRVNPRY